SSPQHPLVLTHISNKQMKNTKSNAKVMTSLPPVSRRRRAYNYMTVPSSVASSASGVVDKTGVASICLCQKFPRLSKENAMFSFMQSLQLFSQMVNELPILYLLIASHTAIVMRRFVTKTSFGHFDKATKMAMEWNPNKYPEEEDLEYTGEP
ncbi:hypothetical protein L9F63_003027, partial [Diploptera punctata]